MFYKPSKWLVSLLTSLVGNIYNFKVKNNVDLVLVDKFSSLDINYDFKLVSSDVTSIFTKVPVDDLLDFFTEILDNLGFPVSISVFIELMENIIVKCSEWR